MRFRVMTLIFFGTVLQGCSGSAMESHRVPGVPESLVPGIPLEVGSTTCYKANVETCAIEHLILDKTNAYRTKSGLQPLKYGYRFSYAARDWSTQQANRGGISHTGFPSARTRFLVAEFGKNVPVDVSVENVAWTGYGSETAEAIASDFAEMWWGSSGHRRNMLGNYQSVGVGVYHGGRGWYATQIFGAE